MIDHTGAFFTKNKIELPKLIESGTIYDENKIG